MVEGLANPRPVRQGSLDVGEISRTRRSSPNAGGAHRSALLLGPLEIVVDLLEMVGLAPGAAVAESQPHPGAPMAFLRLPNRASGNLSGDGGLVDQSLVAIWPRVCLLAMYVGIVWRSTTSGLSGFLSTFSSPCPPFEADESMVSISR